jgi:serine/threonine-protein kinase
VTDPFVGQVINGKFRVIAPIGQGGMGKIYRAEQMPLGRPVALKLLRQSQGIAEHDPAFQRRFFLEASLCAKLSHPNIVTIYDYGRIENLGENEEAFFLAMEYLDGVTLNQRLRERGAILSVAESLAIGLEIARGLREAHKHGIVHRDLKPGNVMLVADEEQGEKVKIVDFGLVKQVEGADREDLTRENSCLGSPKYMSPEQVEQGDVDLRSDLYSLGVILYQCLCGRAPFEFEKSVLILMAHVSTPVPPMRERNPLTDVPPSVEAFVRRLLEKKPEARPASADAVIQQLRALHHEIGATTHSTQPIPRASLGLPIVAPAGSITGETTNSGRQAVESPSDTSHGTLVGTQINGKQPRRGAMVPLLIGLGVLTVLGGGAALAMRSSHAQTSATTVAGTQPLAASAEGTHTLRIESTPSGATVTEGGRTIGTTPMMVVLEASQLETRHLEVTLAGFQSYSLTQPPAHENVRVMAALTALPSTASATPSTAVGSATAGQAGTSPSTSGAGAPATTTAANNTTSRPASGGSNVAAARRGARQRPTANGGGGGTTSAPPPAGNPALDIRLER